MVSQTAVFQCMVYDPAAVVVVECDLHLKNMTLNKQLLAISTRNTGGI